MCYTGSPRREPAINCYPHIVFMIGAALSIPMEALYMAPLFVTMFMHCFPYILSSSGPSSYYLPCSKTRATSIPHKNNRQRQIVLEDSRVVELGDKQCYQISRQCYRMHRQCCHIHWHCCHIHWQCCHIHWQCCHSNRQCCLNYYSDNNESFFGLITLVP